VKVFNFPIFAGTLADLLINFSAGWFGLVLIAPGLTQLTALDDWMFLTRNLGSGTVVLLLAYLLRRSFKQQ